MTQSRSDAPVRPTRAGLVGLAVAALAGIGLGAAPATVADAIEVPGPADQRVASLIACEPDATALVAIVGGASDPLLSEVVADFVGRVESLDRDAEVLVLSAADAEVVAPWQAVGSTTADRVLDSLPGGGEEPGDAPPLDATALDRARAESADRAAELAADGLETCRLTVAVHDAVPEELVAATADDVVFATGDHREAAGELEAVVAALGVARTSITPLGVCAGESCSEGSTTVDVDPLLGRFTFTVLLPDEPVQVLVELPRGIELPVDPTGGPIDAGTFTLTTTWVTPQILRLDAAVSPLDADWPGDWTITVVAPDRAEAAPVGSAHVIETVSVGLEPRLVGMPQLVVGREVPVAVELYDRSDRFVEADEVPGQVGVRAEAVGADGDVVASTVLEPADDGLWRGLLVAGTVGDDAGPYWLRLALEASDGDGVLPARVTTARIGVLGSEAVPSLDSSTVSVRGDAGSAATGELVVVAGEGVDACVWLGDGSDPGVTLGAGAVSPASCVTVPAGERGSVPVSVDASDLEAGSHTATAVVALGIGDGAAVELLDVDLDVEVLAPVDSTRRLAVAALLGLAGLAAPLLALWLFDSARARFRPSKAAVAIDLGVVVRSDGSLCRSGAEASPLIFSDDMCEPAHLSRGRRSEWRGLRFAVRNPLSPFRPPVAVVGSPDGPVVAHLGAIVDDDDVVGRVAPGLASAWIFVLDPDATRAAATDVSAPDFFSAHGRLVLIRSSIDADPVDVSALGRQAQRLARTVRSAKPGGDDGEETTREMLDFVDVNVSTPRDLPRRSSRFEAAALESPERKLARWEDYEGLDAAEGPEGDEPDDELYPDPAEQTGPEGGELDLPVWEAGGRRAAERGDDAAANDDQPAESVEQDPDTITGFGIVFEDRVNPQAFLDDGEPPPGEPAPAPVLDDEAASPTPGETAGADQLGWARRSRPQWPTARGRDDT